MNPSRIVIIGGGFAGVQCARSLRRLLRQEQCEIVVFNRENHMVFHPLLAEAAGAAIAPQHVAAPLRQLLKGVKCRTENVIELNLKQNSLTFQSHDGRPGTMGYDHLVIACGATTNLGIIPGMSDHAYALKTIGDALSIQGHVMEQLEKAEVCDDPDRKKWYLSFVIVGGGFSGVEIAGEINELVRKSLRFFQNISSAEISVTIIHSRDELLPEVSPPLRRFAREKMEQAGVRVMLDARAVAATPEGIVLSDGSWVRGATVVCTIGTTALPFIQALPLPKDGQRLVTEADMSITGFPNVWAIGDCAAIPNAASGARCPPVAQFAERQGKQVARNIAARMKGERTHPFSYESMGQLCAIGGRNAVAEVLGWRMSGFLAWFVWRGTYLMKLPSWAQTIKVAAEWAWELLFPRQLAYLRSDRTRRVSQAYYGPGDFIFKKGDAAADFYIVEEGEVEVLSHRDDSGELERIALLGAGDFFGEGALLDSRPRNNSVRACTDVRLVVLGSEVFNRVSASLAPLRQAVAQAVKRRTAVWKHLPEATGVLQHLPLSQFIEPLSEGAALHADDPIEVAVDRINRLRIDLCCVVDHEGRLTGLVSRSDLLRAIEVAAGMAGGLQRHILVSDLMSPEPIVVTTGETTAMAVAAMREHGLKKLPVVDSYQSMRLHGYIRIENVMDAVLKEMAAGRTAPA